MSAGPDTHGRAPLPVANTHLHLPPNFSAFRSAEDAVETGAREGVRVMGTANFHDLRVNARFAAAAERAGIVPLFGLEAISLVDELQEDGIRVNDPVNPGRMYLCGKGISGYDDPNAAAGRILAVMRDGNEGRMRRMTARLDACFAQAGFDAGLTDESIAADTADRAGVPRDWVVLQERHLALAFQRAVFEAIPPERPCRPADERLRAAPRGPRGRSGRHAGRDPVTADEGRRRGVRAGDAGPVRGRVSARARARRDPLLSDAR